MQDDFFADRALVAKALRSLIAALSARKINPKKLQKALTGFSDAWLVCPGDAFMSFTFERIRAVDSDLFCIYHPRPVTVAPPPPIGLLGSMKRLLREITIDYFPPPP